MDEYENAIRNVLNYVPKEGHCFQNAIMQGLKLKLERSITAKVVHGKVRGQLDMEGKIFVHAWVEYEGRAWDMDAISKETVEISSNVYRLMGRVTDCVEYEMPDTFDLMDSSGHSGPWDPTLMEHWYEERPENRLVHEEYNNECT